MVSGPTCDRHDAREERLAAGAGFLRVAIVGVLARLKPRADGLRGGRAECISQVHAGEVGHAQAALGERRFERGGAGLLAV